jgi:hypothetical protein
MKHPTNRSERRHERNRIIAWRRFISQHIWRSRFLGSGFGDDEFNTWGKYAKFNLGCGCIGCHAGKYFSDRRKRRDALNSSGNDQLEDM